MTNTELNGLFVGVEKKFPLINPDTWATQASTLIPSDHGTNLEASLREDIRELADVVEQPMNDVPRQKIRLDTLKLIDRKEIPVSLEGSSLFVLSVLLVATSRKHWLRYIDYWLQLFRRMNGLQHPFKM